MNNQELITYLINCDMEYLIERIYKLDLNEVNKILEQELQIKAILVKEVVTEEELDELIFRLNIVFNHINNRKDKLELNELKKGLF